MRFLAYAGLSLAIGLLCSEVQAQEGFRLNRFTVAPSPEDGFALQLPDTVGHLQFGARLALDYARAPLTTSLGVKSDIVSDALGGELALSLGLTDRLELFAALPATLFQAGDERVLVMDKFGLSDARVGASAHLFGDGEHGPQLGITAAARLPTGSPDAMAGDGGIGGGGAALFGWYTSRVRAGLQVGGSYRPKRELGGFEAGSELSFVAGAEWRVKSRIGLLGELDGAWLVTQKFAGGDGLPLEARIGARYDLLHNLTLGGGVGAGITGSPGTPLARAFVVLDYTPRKKAASAPHSGQGSSDLNSEGSTAAGEPAQVAAAPEAVPAIAFSHDDRDRDTFPDGADFCPDEAEDMDGFEDDDGCPEPDNDADGKADERDKCPLEPETFNNVDDDDGCPDWSGAIVVGRLQGVAPVWFDIADAKIHEDSVPALEAVRVTLSGHPEIAVLTVVGHSSSDGADSLNRSLARARARHVREWLIEHGISARRVRMESRGSDEPLEDNSTPRGMRRNRRVEFHVTKLAAPAAKKR
jgi:outer membrane protein OmpA-like peptidoglycan-associated protein